MAQHLRALSGRVSVCGQLDPADMRALAEAGVFTVINNRPDDEDPGQPSSDVIGAAARAAGLDYLHAPIWGLPDEPTIAVVAERLAADAARDGRTVLFCRSGMRSAAVWAMAERSRGADPADLRTAAAGAGYDLGRVPL